ncbi:hypothetical protein PG984_014161 [Apiospora sp. TS-2023a]
MQFSSALALVGALAASVAQANEVFVGCSRTMVSSYSETSQFMTFGECAKICRTTGACGKPTAMGLSDQVCHCGKLPDQNDLVDEALCNTPCPGYGMDSCGGPNTFSVFTI